MQNGQINSTDPSYTLLQVTGDNWKPIAYGYPPVYEFKRDGSKVTLTLADTESGDEDEENLATLSMEALVHLRNMIATAIWEKNREGGEIIE